MIQKLPIEVYQKIKAGEVIEDPSSIVRELLDNAIDANSTSISVEVTNGGLDSIIVKDNGKGMSYDDLQIAFLEHTTSKIRSFEDIHNLQTNGFRGEALASICQVARINISSAQKDAITTHKIIIENNQITGEYEIAHRIGTIIEVSHIFNNFPVRKQFLKSKIRENSKIKKEILYKALSYPAISFKFISNGKLLLECPLGQTPEERMFSLLSIKPPIHPLFYKTAEISIKGTITGIDQVFDTASELYIFINHRPLQSKSIYGVINRALSQLIPRHKYLGGCIYIFTDSKHIDPNVHPAKKEVKIAVEDAILRGLYSSLRSIFYSSDYQTFIDLPQAPLISSEPLSASHSIFYTPSKQNLQKPITQPTLSFSTTIDTSHNSVTPDSMVEIPAQEQLDYQYIGTYKGTYWLVEKNEHMVLIDFHAAHERMRYEKIKQDLLAKNIDTQPLLTPYIGKLSEEEWIFMENSQQTWESLGFEIDLLGDFCILIRTVPVFIGSNAVEDILKFISEHYSQSFDLVDLKDPILKFAACRKSFMANDYVPQTEINYLLKAIFNRDFPLTCPHGRPFVFALDNKTIESHFLR